MPRETNKVREEVRAASLEITNCKQKFKQGSSGAYSSSHTSESSVDHDDLEIAQLRIGTAPLEELRELPLSVLQAEPFQLFMG